jgi:hypothetical protein
MFPGVELLHRVAGLLIPDVPKEHSAYIFKDQGAHDSTLEVIQNVWNLQPCCSA